MESVISVHDVKDTYYVPALLEAQGVVRTSANKLKM